MLVKEKKCYKSRCVPAIASRLAVSCKAPGPPSDAARSTRPGRGCCPRRYAASWSVLYKMLRTRGVIDQRQSIMKIIMHHVAALFLFMHRCSMAACRLERDKRPCRNAQENGRRRRGEKKKKKTSFSARAQKMPSLAPLFFTFSFFVFLSLSLSDYHTIVQESVRDDEKDDKGALCLLCFVTEKAS